MAWFFIFLRFQLYRLKIVWWSGVRYPIYAKLGQFGGNYEKSVFLADENVKPFFIDFASRVQAQIDWPIVVTGGFRSQASMEQAIEEGSTAMIGMARPFVLNPNLVKDNDLTSINDRP